MTATPTNLPTTLGGHFKRRAPAYLGGGLVLLIFQIAMNRIDWLSKSAVDEIFGPIYYRMLLRITPLDQAFGDALLDQVLGGVRNRRA